MLLTGLVLWSRMMAGFPWCLGVNCLEFVSRSPLSPAHRALIKKWRLVVAAHLPLILIWSRVRSFRPAQLETANPPPPVLRTVVAR